MITKRSLIPPIPVPPTSLIIIPMIAISANLNNGIEVSLGDSDDIAKKERVVTKLLSQVEGVTYINVRSPGNYTFRNAPTS